MSDSRANTTGFGGVQDLAKRADSLDREAVRLDRLGQRVEAAAVGAQAVETWRSLCAVLPGPIVIAGLVASLKNLAVGLQKLGRHDEAFAQVSEAVALGRTLPHINAPAFADVLAESLNDLGSILRDLGWRKEALSALTEASKLAGDLARSDPQHFAPNLAAILSRLGLVLRELGRHEEALAKAEEAVRLHRGLAVSNPGTFAPHLAASLHNLGLVLGRLGRPDEAVTHMMGALDLDRMHASTNPQAFAPGLAACLSDLGNLLGQLGRHERALAAAEESVELRRVLAQSDPRAFTADLARSLNNLGPKLWDVGRHQEARAAVDEAVWLRRELARASPEAFTSDLATSLTGLSAMLRELGMLEDAVAAAQEACELYRPLARADPPAFTAALAMSLSNLGDVRRGLNRHDLARAAYRECGGCVLSLRPDDPFHWRQLSRWVALQLGSPRELRQFHLGLLRLLTEHRELAWNSEHAQVFLELQAEVAARVWELLPTLPAEATDLLDEAVATLVTALQSPDLARWLEARGSGDGPLAKLAELKREVIEAEQFLAALRKGLRGDGESGLRTGPTATSAEAERAMADDIERQATKAQALRQAFRDERARLVAEDPRFAAAFEPLGTQALRAVAGHAHGAALLCVLQVEASGSHGQTEPSLPVQQRTVAALLHADGRATQLLELPGVSELAWHAQCYALEEADRARGLLRGAKAGVPGSAPTGASAPGIADLLAPRMSDTFWLPLQQALQQSSPVVERLHVCLHGTTQQLPLALRQDSDCPGLQVVPWPGLPYLRLAASAGAATSTSTPTTVPWLIGHDCAWASAQPLPMVAVEAALLRHLLPQHGRPVQAIGRAAQLSGDAAALVACCHGGAEQAHFDHALHLGGQPLAVRQILDERLGPDLALLPACYAGRTDEDAAGNALGVAAAFMLSGTKVVVASSKAVPDVLQPWLSTLMVWHAMQGKPHHEAATLARAQFASLQFPEGYRSWLQQALPRALATIQPGGEEDQHIRGVHAQLALEQVRERWPWEGETEHLFSADRHRCEAATRSVVQGILRPRGGEEGAKALIDEARDMAAFVFVYGID